MTDEEFLKRMKAARARFREAKMKAHFPVNAKMRQELDKFAHNAVIAERADIAQRAMYICLLAMDQAGLSARTMRRVRDWAKTLLDEKGVPVPGTGEPL